MSAPLDVDPNLEYLCKGYFHQDFDIEGENAAAILDSFSKDALEVVVGARDAATTLLASDAREEELFAHLDAAGMDYYPPGGGTTYRQWLELVVERLTARLDERQDR